MNVSHWRMEKASCDPWRFLESRTWTVSGVAATSTHMPPSLMGEVNLKV